MKESFSWRRFGLLARAELAGERRGLLLRLGGFALFCIAMYIVWNINVIFGHDKVYDGVGFYVPRLIVFVGLAFVVLLNLSRSFKRYFSKGRAVEAFMLPAARSEKFLWVALKNLIAVPVALLAIILLNDLFWGEVLGFDNLCALFGRLWREMSLIRQMFLWSQIMMCWVLNVAAAMTFFLAGAVVFRRHQFLWTVLVVFLLSNPLSIWIQVAPMWMAQFVTSLFEVDGISFLNVFLFCLIILWVWIAWRRFSRLQITK